MARAKNDRSSISRVPHNEEGAAYVQKGENGISSLKAAFRKSLTRAALTDADDAKMREYLYALPEWQSAKNVFIYVSVDGEPDTRRIIRDALNSGKRVAVPKTLGRGHMKALLIDSLDALETGRFGIPEPPGSLAPMNNIDVAVIPCLACDGSGNRIGHGGGYYDSFLSGFGGTTVGVCYAKCTVGELPRGVFDRAVDIVITEKFCNRTKR